MAICCTAFAACSDAGDSSETKSAAENTTTTAEVSEAPDETEVTEPDEEPTPDEEEAADTITTADEIVEFEYDGELFAETYTEKLMDNHFSLSATIESELLGEIETSDSFIECAGTDFHQQTTYGEVVSDMYLFDKNLYILYEDTKSYSVMDYSMYMSDDSMDFASMALGLTDELVLTNRTVDDDGLIVEEYTYNSPYVSASDFADGELPKYLYYFKDNGDIVKIDITFNGTVQTYKINSIDFDIEEVVLPDLSDWTLEDNGMGEDGTGPDESDIQIEVEADDSAAIEIVP